MREALSVWQDELTARAEQDLTLVKIGYLGMIGVEERFGGRNFPGDRPG